MFTLGDVADILDSALNTGISIVDALSKLSDAADNNGELNKEKCLESFKIKNKVNKNGDSLFMQADQYTPATLELDSCETSSHQDQFFFPQEYSGSQTFTPQPPVAQEQLSVKKRIRPSTFILKDSSIKTANDAKFHRIPIIDALDDLCVVADDVFKDFDEKQKSSFKTKRSFELNNEKSIQLEALINDKVNEILESFKRLDLTVDQILTRKVVTEHLKQNTESSHLLKQTTRVSLKHSSAEGFNPCSFSQSSVNVPLEAKSYHSYSSNIDKRSTYILSKDGENCEEKGLNTDNSKKNIISDFKNFQLKNEGNVNSETENIKLLSRNFPDEQKKSADLNFNDFTNQEKFSIKSSIRDYHKQDDVISKKEFCVRDSQHLNAKAKSDGSELESHRFSNYESNLCNYNDSNSSLLYRKKHETRTENPLGVRRATYTLSDSYPKASTVIATKEHIVDPEPLDGMNRSSSDPNLLDDEYQKNSSEKLFRSFSVSEGFHLFSQPTMSNLNLLNSIMSTSLTKLNSLQLLQEEITSEQEVKCQNLDCRSLGFSSGSCSSDEYVGDKEQENSNDSFSISSEGSTFSILSDVSGRTYSISPDHDKNYPHVYLSENDLQKFPFSTNSASHPPKPSYSRSISFPIEDPVNDYSVYDIELPQIDRQISCDSSATFTVLYPEDNGDVYTVIKKENSFIFIDSNEACNEITDTECTLSDDTANPLHINPQHCYQLNDVKSLIFSMESNVYNKVMSNPNNNEVQLVKMREEKGRRGSAAERTNTYLINSSLTVPGSSDTSYSSFTDSVEVENNGHTQCASLNPKKKNSLSKAMSNNSSYINSNSLPFQIEQQTVSNQKDNDISQHKKANTEKDNSSKQLPKNQKLNNQVSLKNVNQKTEKAKHTQFLRRKMPLVSYPEVKNKNDPEPLSSRLAALRMQLEEKRRQFEEEKKRKQSDWNKEKAKLLQNAFFEVVFSGKENQDPNKTIDDCKPTSDICFDGLDKKEHNSFHLTNLEAELKPSITAEKSTELSKQTEKKKGLLRSSTSKGAMWFVGVDEQVYSSNDSQASAATFANNLVQNECNLESSLNNPKDVLQKSSKFTAPVLNGDTFSPEVSSYKNNSSTSFLPLSYTKVDEEKLLLEANKVELKQSFDNESEPISHSVSSSLNRLSLNNGSNEMLSDNYFTPSNSFNKQLDNGLEVEPLTTSLTNFSPVFPVPGITSSGYGTVTLDQDHNSPQTASSYANFNEKALEGPPLPLVNNFANSVVNSNTSTYSSNNFSQENFSPSPDKHQAFEYQSINNNEVQHTPQKCSHPSEADFNTSEMKEMPSYQSNTPNMAMDQVIGGDADNKSPQSYGFTLEENDMTPEQQKKKERFIQNRMKKLQIEKEKKKAALEKKTQEEEKLVAAKLLQEEENRLVQEKLKEQRLLDEATSLQSKMYNKRLHELTYNTNQPPRKEQLPTTVKPPMQREENRTQTSVPNHPAYRPHSYTNAETLFNACSSPIHDGASAVQSVFSEYNGPMNYQKPSGKSNKKIMQNAIMHCCLCGEVNKEAKSKCLETIALSDANHFLVLFREGLKFRSVYAYNPEEQTITRIYGIGPKILSPKMISKYYKYNSGAKEFYTLDTKHLSIQVDGVMIKKELWEKKSFASKTDSNLKPKALQNKPTQR